MERKKREDISAIGGGNTAMRDIHSKCIHLTATNGSSYSRLNYSY